MTWTRVMVMQRAAEAIRAYRDFAEDRELEPTHATELALRELGEQLDVDELERNPNPLAIPTAAQRLRVVRGRK